MKRIKNLIILFAAVLLTTACNNNEDSIFDQSSTERMNELFDECTNTLTGSEKGWNMQYFINPESAGYNLLLNFTGESNVTIAGNNYLTDNEYLESASTYDMNLSNGPILEFNTYNDVLHPFADPDGYSLAGDYEFVIMSVSSDTIVLKGKKNDVIIRMNKITEDIGFEKYLNELDSIDNLLFYSDAPALTLEVDGSATAYSFSGGSSSIFTIESSDTTITAPFIIARTGFRLYEKESLSGYNAQNFVLTDDNKALVSTEASNVKLTGPENIANYFAGTSSVWVIDESTMSDNVKSLYETTITAVKNKYSGASNIYLALTGISSSNVFSLRLGFSYKKKTINADLYFDYQVDGTTALTLSYKNGAGNSAGTALAKSIDGYADLAKLISDSFNLSTTFPLTVTDMTFTKSGDSNTYFYLKH